MGESQWLVETSGNTESGRFFSIASGAYGLALLGIIIHIPAPGAQSHTQSKTIDSILIRLSALQHAHVHIGVCVRVEPDGAVRHAQIRYILGK